MRSICYTSPMTRPHPLLFELQQLTVDLSLVDRKHYLPHSKRNENDVEHSFTVALLCWYLHEKVHPELDMALILKYAMAHDFVERYAGDVPSFASKEAREEKSDEESVFVWTVDKMQQLIMGDLDEWTCYMEDDISYNRFAEKYTDIAQKGSQYCRQIFDELIAYSQSTYPTRPR